MTPLQVLPQVDDLGMEGKGKQHLLLEFIFDFLDDEAVLGDFEGKFDLLDVVLKLVGGEFVEFGNANVVFGPVILFFDLIVGYIFNFIKTPVINTNIDQ